MGGLVLGWVGGVGCCFWSVGEGWGGPRFMSKPCYFARNGKGKEKKKQLEPGHFRRFCQHPDSRRQAQSSSFVRVVIICFISGDFSLLRRLASAVTILE